MVFGESARRNILIHVSHSVTLFLFSLTPQQHGLQERYPALLVLHSTLKVARMPPVFFARRVLSCIFLSFPHFPPHRQHITVVNFMLSLRGCIKSSFIIRYIDLGAALVPQQHYLQHARTGGSIELHLTIINITIKNVSLLFLPSVFLPSCRARTTLLQGIKAKGRGGE